MAQAGTTIINEGPSELWTAVAAMLPAAIALLVVYIGGRQQDRRFERESEDRKALVRDQALVDRNLRREEVRRELYATAILAVDRFLMRSDHSSTMAVVNRSDPEGDALRWEAQVAVRELLAQIDLIASADVRDVAARLGYAIESAPHPTEFAELNEWIDSEDVQLLVRVRGEFVEVARVELSG